MNMSKQQSYIVCFSNKFLIYLLRAYSGLRKLGIPVSFINFNLKAESLAKCIEATDSKILIVGEGKLDQLEKLV